MKLGDVKVGKYTVRQIRKFLIAASGALGLLLTSFLEDFVGIIPEDWANPINWVIGALTAVGVFLIRNADLIDNAPGPE